ncbi:hypothetical protein Q1695_001740 [Nippostrongylus brasiliensis]|nr:hypothetical protein Q1695_001740 [Nippostrongylus brasiliensis]
MSSTFVFTLFTIVPSLIYALKCHQVATANLSNPPDTQATECIGGSLTCTKLVDYTSKTFSKQCQPLNCSVGSMMNVPAQCINTTQLGRESVSCCCYGDGCNSAPFKSVWLTLGAVIVSVVGTWLLI